MNRFHVHLNVADLAASIRFYSELFAAQPANVEASSSVFRAASEPAKSAAPEMKLLRPAPEPCGS